jgi:hypothetical protein
MLDQCNHPKLDGSFPFPRLVAFTIATNDERLKPRASVFGSAGRVQERQYPHAQQLQLTCVCSSASRSDNCVPVVRQ